MGKVGRGGAERLDRGLWERIVVSLYRVEASWFRGWTVRLGSRGPLIKVGDWLQRWSPPIGDENDIVVSCCCVFVERVGWWRREVNGRWLNWQPGE